MYNPFSAPSSRLRIYTYPWHYTQTLMELALGKFSSGDAVAELEDTIAEDLGVRHAVAMPQARVGIYFTLKSVIKPGQKVICSPYTIADVINMIVCAGGEPVFADIDRQTCNVMAREIERLLDDTVGAVLVTHFYGLMADVAEIRDLCRRYGVPIIEDAAQAFGARANQRPAGTFGDAGIYSFGMFKNVNAFFGGMVVTDDDQLADRLRRHLSALPMQPRRGLLAKSLVALITDVITHPLVFKLLTFWLFRFGYLHDIDAINDKLKIDVDPKLSETIRQDYLIRMSPLQARLIMRQLPLVARDFASRLERAALYHDGLSDIEELVTPPLWTDGSHVYWYYSIQYPERHDLVAYAMENGRDISLSYHRDCSSLPCFQPWHRDCPNAAATAASLVYLPVYPRYPISEIEANISVIRRFFGK